MKKYSVNKRRYLLITEKLNPPESFQDGGFRLVQTLKKFMADNLDVIQFGEENSGNCLSHVTYPNKNSNRFLRRIANADFIADTILKIADNYTDFIFIHISMVFGFQNRKPSGKTFWVFPMFLTPSYIQSNENPPNEYSDMEFQALELADRIISPSYYEREQITKYYSIPIDKIKVIPRGINMDIFPPTLNKVIENDKIVFCCLGSIKKQKNTIGLIQLFAKICNVYPKSILNIIGAIQDSRYFDEVLMEIDRFKLKDNVFFKGHIILHNLSSELSNAHIHISTSNCETFGRAIFETLSSGIPNICKKSHNAVYDYLVNYPFIRFYDREDEAIEFIAEILKEYSTYVPMCSKIGRIYDENKLGVLIASELQFSEKLIISDFDGTLYRKNNIPNTSLCIQQFNKYNLRIICTSRPLQDIQIKIQELKLEPDYIIAWSGAVIADKVGEILWVNGIDEENMHEVGIKLPPDIIPVSFSNRVIQYVVNGNINEKFPFKFRTENYQDKTFISAWDSTKLIAIQKLLDLIGWEGRVVCYGDSKYDQEYLRFYDGFLVTGKNNDNIKLRTIEEIEFENEYC